MGKVEVEESFLVRGYLNLALMAEYNEELSALHCSFPCKMLCVSCVVLSMPRSHCFQWDLSFQHLSGQDRVSLFISQNIFYLKEKYFGGAL